MKFRVIGMSEVSAFALILSWRIVGWRPETAAFDVQRARPWHPPFLRTVPFRHRDRSRHRFSRRNDADG